MSVGADARSAALGRLARADCFVRRDLESCLRAVAETAAAHLDVERCGVWLFTPEGDAITCATLYRRGERTHGQQGTVLRAADFPRYFAAMREERIIAAEDAASDPRTSEFAGNYIGEFGIGALMDAPILFQGRLAGILCSEHVGGPRRWSVEETAFAASLSDFVALALANEENRRAEARYRALFENAVEGIFQLALDGRIVAANPALVRLLGFPSAEALLARTEPAGALFARPDQRDELRGLMDRHGLAEGFEALLNRADGPQIWISVNVRAVRGPDGAPTHFEGTAEDITHRKRAEAEIASAALHDGLTRLPTRALLYDRIDQALARARAGHGGGVAVLLLDFDNFRLVNTSLGPSVGDRLLVEMARRLQDALAPGDTLARIGSDDFAVLAEGVADADSALARAEALRDAVSVPLELDGNELFPTACVGAVWDDGGRPDPDELLRDAGIAVHNAKGAGKGRCVAFDPGMRSAPREALRLQSEMRRALEREQFELHFQPLVDLATRHLLGFEALVRWRHPQRGMVPPSAFIPAAEESGLMEPLGDWILNAACMALRGWQDRLAALGRADAPLSLSVNISPVQLVAKSLAGTVEAALAASGADIRRLELEVTETALAQEVEVVSRRLEQLRRLGLRVLIDDFGTGYSSLSRLHRLPFDGLKIDQGFVRPMLYDPDCASIVRTVAALGQAMQVGIVAEGVEDAATADALARLGPARAQGYHFARPMPAEQAAALVERLAAGPVVLPVVLPG
ncbi:MAG TPA: EAL domain-containing protein [Azospirillaceae bacterium]|nr:EAL domain-containing protein [Azospirillaceae bacterium]